ncbi:hypothetical protein OF83DRAFT_1276417 [Amylostereum chailletii]|nr:hypothetical protein OF83DRAFT_1276417 [Amylostereum chailletii]
MSALADIVHDAVNHTDHASAPSHPQSPPDTPRPSSPNGHANSSSHPPSHENGSAPGSPTAPSRPTSISHGSPDSGLKPHRSYYASHERRDSDGLTPSLRTGPPRSVSYTYTMPSTMTARWGNGDIAEESREDTEAMEAEDDPGTYDYTPRESQYRGAFESPDPEQLEREREVAAERRGKRLSSSKWEDFRRWLPESFSDSPRATPRGSPREEKPEFEFGVSDRQEGAPRNEPSSSTESPRPKAGTVPKPSIFGTRIGIPRSRSLPHLKEDGKEDGPSSTAKGKQKERPDESGGGTSKSPQAKWNRLRFLIPHVAQQAAKEPMSQAVTPLNVNITDELITGGLSTLMLRLWIEHDERDRRRVPILFHRLRVRISDSLHPLHGTQSVFRIECEYANGAVRWVIYRQLRDFLSLHTHYAVSNAYNRNIDTLPEFPRTSIPYLKFLKKEHRQNGGNDKVPRADFARLQREALENYLISLIRAVMFHPTSNRLAGFLEISALMINRARSGGNQYKAGYLKIEASSSRGSGFGRKSAGRTAKREQRWCAIRESYLVAVDEPGELTVWDVFMLDSDFRIERPTRYYRQGLNLLQGEVSAHEHGHHHNQERRSVTAPDHDDTTDRMSLLGSIKSRFSRVLHPHHAYNGDTPRPSTSTRPRSSSVSSSDSSTSSSSSDSRPPTPLLDPSTNTNPITEDGKGRTRPGADKKKSNEMSKHTFYIVNSQLRLKLFARGERQMLQWIAALEKVAATSHYTGGNRFDSYAPIRLNVAAQWLVDGRDYFWNLSRAILLARESIYIHDWWLSPELQLRRPGKPKYRLDRLLQKKATEGVKVYIILYQEVSSRTTPTDSNYSKQRLTSLHPNIMVQRSPSHFQTGTFYWAHHEKLCVIDETIAFMGGLDLSFGRWDTSQHVIVDDPDDEEQKIWPGKDYNNARVSDFHTLNKPDDDMHDRQTTPRMPWHDVGLQIVGQPVRDLGRHFVQRWNHLLRIKNHSRTMPFLLPPSEFKSGELDQLGLTGTCELQICRSAGPWSLGTPDRIEHSIQNAYLKAIQMSEHFVYIENQFFITSTVVGDVTIENKIGDAIVHRIIRAHHEGTPWKCCVVIPLLPGFPMPVDHNDGSSVRIILECQNRTIGRGPNSIFSRLRKEGIDPENYFAVFSLRNWGKLRGDVLSTELVYIHGKVCIVDDRLAIIGSANINERSQRGDRDSEIAAIIRDTDMIDGTMAGKPFKVGRFAHSLRVRLMREHIGVDVDAMDEEDLMRKDQTKYAYEQEPWDPDAEQRQGNEDVTKAHGHTGRLANMAKMGDDALGQLMAGGEEIGSKSLARASTKLGLKGEMADARTGDEMLKRERQTFGRDGEVIPGFASAMVPTLEEKMVFEHRPAASKSDGEPIEENPATKAQEEDGTAPQEARLEDGQLFGAPADASESPEKDNEPPHARSGKDDADEEEQKAPRARSILRKHLTAKLGQTPWDLPTPTPNVDPDGFDDPVCDEFWKDVWVASAVHNVCHHSFTDYGTDLFWQTEIFRRVFHSVPDDLVTTWKQYIEFVAHHERLSKPSKDEPGGEPVARVPSETGDLEAPGEHAQEGQRSHNEELIGKSGIAMASSQSGGPNDEESNVSLADAQSHNDDKPSSQIPSEKTNGAEKAKKTKGEAPFTKQEREEMEKLLGRLNGTLVIYPTRFMEGEDVANNFLFNTDRLMPLPIYD